MLALWLQKIVLRSGSYDIIKGKSMRPMLIKLRGAKIPLLVISLLSLVVIVVVPLVMIILVGLLRAYGLPLKLENFTFDNYINLFKSKMVKDSVVNSLTLSVSAGLIAMFLGVMIAYVIQKIRPKGKTVLEIISILPYSIPGIVLAIGVILSWSGAFGINLYNTPVDHPDCVYRALPRLLDEVRLRVPAAGSLFAGRRGAHLRRNAF